MAHEMCRLDVNANTPAEVMAGVRCNAGELAATARELMRASPLGTTGCALHAAASNNDVRLVRAILSVDPAAGCREDDDNDIPMRVALARRSYDAIKEMVRHETSEPGRYIRLLASHKPRDLRHLIVDVITTSLASMQQAWRHVPRRCCNLLGALTPMLRSAPDDLAMLVVHMEAGDQRRVQWAVRAIYAAEKKFSLHLPREIHQTVLEHVFDAA